MKRVGLIVVAVALAEVSQRERSSKYFAARLTTRPVSGAAQVSGRPAGSA